MTALAILYHDPEGQLRERITRTLPVLTSIFDSIAICASPQANPEALSLWESAGARIEIESRGDDLPIYRLGAARRTAVTLALESGAAHVLYCDGDRVLHWADHYPDELRQVAARILAADFTVLGRTARAFASHPGVQRDTERIINTVFRRVTGLDWDMGSGARGLSRRAIEALNAHCTDETISVDVTWPLCLRKQAGLTLGYVLAEGLEFETGDGYGHEQVAAADYAHWLDALDDDPRRWAYRLKVAQLQVEKISEYA
ncbi:MAG: hypothetical protein K8J31_29935 [Anaerolineae bacterium]|nr:hypothetical protein [Anaerolineae bacterium]